MKLSDLLLDYNFEFLLNWEMSSKEIFLKVKENNALYNKPMNVADVLKK